MKNPIDVFLRERPVIVLDGALATELERRGADLHDPLWSAKTLIERPDLIRAVHRDYFHCGADVATTATYQATFDAFGRRGIDRHAAAQLMRDAVRLAVAARDDYWDDPAHRIGRLRPLVAASVGPYGAMLADGSEYRGHYSLSDRELGDFHRPRLEVLARSGADLLACETIPSLREALLLARLLQEYPAISAWISFSCQDGERTCEGQHVADCAAALQPFAQIAAIGVNCTSPGHVGELLRRMGSRTDKPLLAYPNSGEHYDAAAKAWTACVATRARDAPCPSDPQLPGDAQADGANAAGDAQAPAIAQAAGDSQLSFADQSRDWYRAGARLIGGCCRTTPDDIGAICRVFSELR